MFVVKQQTDLLFRVYHAIVLSSEKFTIPVLNCHIGWVPVQLDPLSLACCKVVCVPITLAAASSPWWYAYYTWPSIYTTRVSRWLIDWKSSDDRNMQWFNKSLLVWWVSFSMSTIVACSLFYNGKHYILVSDYGLRSYLSKSSSRNKVNREEICERYEHVLSAMHYCDDRYLYPATDKRGSAPCFIITSKLS